MTSIFERNQRLVADSAHVDHWRRIVAETTEPTVLVRDYLGHEADGPVARESADLTAAAVEAATRVTGGDETLLRVVHVAVLAVVTARVTDRQRVTVLAPAPAAAAVSALPLTVTVTGTFRALLGAVRGAYLEAAAHAGVPFWLVYERAGVRPTDVALGAHEECPLRVTVAGARVELAYRADLFARDTASRLVGDYARIFAAVLADPATAVDGLLVADATDVRLLTAFNDTAREFPADALLHGFLEEQARCHPDRVAVVDDGTTYDALNRAANRLAHHLRTLGVGRGDVVGVCLPRSRRELVAIYAVLKAGGCYLPVDASLPRNRIDYLLDHSGTRVVVGDAGTRAAVSSVGVFVDMDSDVGATTDDTDPVPVTDAGDLCYVIYTSGSTGRPKGVMIEHRAIVNRLVWMQRAHPVGPGDVILHKTPFSFDVSVWEIFWWSVAGAAVATLPSGDERDPERVVEHLARHGVTTTHFVPPMLRAFLEYVDAAGAVADLSGLRTVFASGEALGTGQVERFRALLGHARLVNLYGPTEAAVDVSCFDTAGADPRRSVPIGRPIDNIALRVLTTGGKIAPVGTPGELCIAGVGLARGYLNAPELTEQRFVGDPAEPGCRLYRTGDLARWTAAGVLEYLGRIDTQVKIRGHRIELGEIEHVAGRLGAVVDCTVTAVPDSAGDKALCAYVVPGEGFDRAAFTAALAAELPAYMVPRWLVEVDAIPTNHNGKRDLGALPEPGRTGDTDGYVPPGSALERALADIWQSVLDVEQVGVHDNFFALGGDSIKFIAVLAAARATGLDFTFQELFANPSIAELVAVVARRDPETAAEAPTAPFELLADADRARLPSTAVDAYPMSALQVGLMYEAARAVPGSGLYHDILSYHIDGSVDVAVFRAAVAAVTARHAIMRTSFHLGGFSEPVQVVHGSVPSRCTVVDLAHLTAAGQDDRLAEFAARELADGFQDGEPDLVRVHLHLLGERGYQYTLSYHDAALDGWSVNTIHRDIFETYFALLDGTAPASDGLTVSYGDFVRAERAAVESPRQAEYWRAVLGRFESTRLPRLGRDGAAGGVLIHDVELTGDVAAGLVRTAAALRVPVKSVLLAAHTAVLAFVAGTDTVLTGYEHSGRPEVRGGERLPGLFLNTVPFGVEVGDRTWAELAREIYRVETELLPYRRFPMMAMKRAAGTREPLFESVFNFTHFHVLKELSTRDGFGMVRSIVNAQTEFPFRAEFSQDAVTDEVRLSLHYHADEFGAERIARVGGYYARALGLLASTPDESLRARTLLGPAELTELTEEFAGPVHPLPAGTLVDRFAAQVEATPDAVALVHGDTRRTYRELDDASARMAGYLADHGVTAGAVVTTLLDRGVDWAVTVLAILKLGAVYLPQEPSYPAERLGAVLRRSGSRHLVAADDAAGAVRAALRAVVPEPPTVLPARTAAGAGRPPRHPTRPRPEDPAYLIFTSGSTGEPKGAVIRHDGLLNHLLAKVVDLDLVGTDRIAQLATQCFDISVWQLVAAWLVGGRTVVIGPEVIADPGALLRGIAAERITVLEVVPSYLDAMLAEAEARPVDLPALRCTLVTGEALPPGLTRRWFDTHDVPLVNAYGPTEASDDVTHHVLSTPAGGDRVPVGRAVLNTSLHVVDPWHRRCPVGTYGEIVVTGVGVGAGYVNDPERTAAAFPPNVLDDRSELMYRTGDVGRWLPGGVLDCAGRLDHQVKVRGFRIELSEIEGAMAHVPGIDAAVVVVRQRGAEKLLAAFYTGSADHDVATVREGLAPSLPSYLHPDSVLRLTAFPLTANGKVDRAALRRTAEAAPVARTVEPPADDDERALAAVFAEVIDVDVAQIGATDNFFDIGGHSIAAMKVAIRLGGTVTLRDLLTHPTVRSLSRHLRARNGAQRDLLIDLTAAAGLALADPVCTLVCVPFAGGSAVSYVDLARQLHPSGVRVLGVELPARASADRAALPADQLGSHLAAEIARTAGPRVALLGHCAGAGPALTAAQALLSADVEVERLFLVAKVLKSSDPQDHTSDEVSGMSEDEILRWLVDNTGFAELDRLSAHGRSDLARAFRYDTAEASHAFAAALRASRPAPFPITVVYAADDRLVRGHERAVANWARFGALDVRVAPDGGHYLNATRPAFLAECVRDGIGGVAAA